MVSVIAYMINDYELVVMYVRIYTDVYYEFNMKAEFILRAWITNDFSYDKIQSGTGLNKLLQQMLSMWKTF